MECTNSPRTHGPWNKGKLVGQKAPLKPKEVWAIRARLQMENRVRELALFDLGIDSKLRACDLVKLRVRDVCHGDRVASRATVLQQKTQRPVQFEITPSTREAVETWTRKAGLRPDDLPVPEPGAPLAPPGHPPVRPHPRWVGVVGWTGPDGLRDPLAASHQGFADLPPDKEPAGGTTATRAQQAGEHGQISRHRGRRRPRAGRAD